MASLKLSLILAGNPDRKNVRRRVKYLRSTKPSRKLELWYKAELLRIVNQLNAEVRKELLPVMERVLAHYQQPVTTDADPLSEIRAAITRIASRFGGIQSVAERLGSLAVQRNLQEVDQNLIRSIREAIGVNITRALAQGGQIASAVQTHVQANIQLISSIPSQYFERLEKVITQNFQVGMRHEELAKQIVDNYDVTVNRAKLIARDQTAKMASNFNEVRQTALGIEKYRWQTSGDERVRESHQENNGKIFRWDDPPPETGHPGEDIQCRCVAIPIFDLDAMEQELTA
jgi:SPP1 gp7 family putative phage head morphogenesis protein